MTRSETTDMTVPVPVTLPPRRERVLLLGAAAVTVVLWASAFVGIRAAAQDFDAGPLTLGRVAVGTLALALLHLALRPRGGRAGEPPSQRRRLRDAPRRVLVGIVVWGVVMCQSGGVVVVGS